MIITILAVAAIECTVRITAENNNDVISQNMPESSHFFSRFKNRIYSEWLSHTAQGINSIPEALKAIVSSKNPTEKAWTEIIDNPKLCVNGEDTGCTAECIDRKEKELNAVNSRIRSKLGLFSSMSGTVVEDKSGSVYKCVQQGEKKYYKCQCTHRDLLKLGSRLQRILDEYRESEPQLSTRANGRTKRRHSPIGAVFSVLLYPLIFLLGLFLGDPPHNPHPCPHTGPDGSYIPHGGTPSAYGNYHSTTAPAPAPYTAHHPISDPIRYP